MQVPAPAPRTTTRHPKLTEAEVTAVIAALEEGAAATNLAAIYQVDKRMIRAIKHKLAWDYLPRSKDFGPLRSSRRVQWDMQTCERLWKAYYEQGQSSRQVADDAGVSTNVVRQMLAGKSHRDLTAHLKRTHPVNSHGNRLEARNAAQLSAAPVCEVCAEPIDPKKPARKTCSSSCLARLRRKPTSVKTGTLEDVAL